LVLSGNHIAQRGVALALAGGDFVPARRNEMKAGPMM
jgi:hypothetical protein